MFKKFPVSKGMAAYAVLWPSSDLCRQLAVKGNQKDENFQLDIPRLLRFSLFGSFWVAPSLYLWVKLSGNIIKGSSIGSAALKAFIEQFTQGPFTIVSFYFGMNLLEGNGTSKAVEEAKTKFFPTWKTAVTFWPFVQTINYSIVPLHNRVVFSGIASFIWTIYLSFMKNPSS